MGEISTRIDSIIEQRKEALPAISKAISKLEECRAKVESFEADVNDSRKNDVKSENPGKYARIFANSKMINEINSFSFEEFYKSYEIYHERLTQLKARFERDKLNISFVGTAGQGKSLIMQQISGLDGTIIPSAEGSDCTGAKSIITNNPAAVVPQAKITFFTKSEMADNVNKYLDEIDVSKNIGRIHSISEVNSQFRSSIQELLDNSKDGGGYISALLKLIDEIISGELDQYYGQKDYLVEASRIEEFVAQYNSNDKDIKYNKYLGVKCADIECSFPHEDAGKIVLVDTVGIGANSLGAEDDITDTIKYNSDVVVIMQRPDSVRYRLDATHSKLAKQIISALTPECSKHTFFWVLNKMQTDKVNNLDAISSVKKDIQNAKMALGDIFSINCSLQDEVENKMITPILDQLSSNMQSIDRSLIDKANECADEVSKSIEKAINDLDNVLVDAEDDGFGEKKETEIENLYEYEILGKLRDNIVFEYRKKCKPVDASGTIPADERFRNKADSILKDILFFIPSIESIVDKLNRGHNEAKNTLIECGQDLNMEILSHFDELDNVLDEMVRELKDKVVKQFTSSEMGRLGYILPYNNMTPEEWIEKFLEKIRAKDNYPSVYTALKDFAEFEFHVNGFMTYKIRNQLWVIDYLAENTQRQVIGRNDPDRRKLVANEIREILKKDMDTVHDKIRLDLKKLYSEPNFALWAAVKNLLERACYLDDGDISAERQWKKLYRKWSPTIWQEEYIQQQGDSETIKEWNSIINSFREYSKDGYFEI